MTRGKRDLMRAQRYFRAALGLSRRRAARA